MPTNSSDTILNVEDNDSPHIFTKSNDFQFNDVEHFQLWKENILQSLRDIELLIFNKTECPDEKCCRRFLRHFVKKYDIFACLSNSSKCLRPYMDFMIIHTKSEFAASEKIEKSMLIIHSIISSLSQTMNDKKVGRLAENAFLIKTSKELKRFLKNVENQIVVVISSAEAEEKFFSLILNWRKHQTAACFRSQLPNMSKSMILNTYYKLINCTSNENVENFMVHVEQHQNNLKYICDNLFVPKSAKGRKLEQCKFPTLSRSLKRELHSALLNDNYHRIIQIFEDERLNPEILDYLSLKHEKLGGSTFLHQAVSNNLCNSVEALLEIGCDFTNEDENGNVPFKFCRTDRMTAVFAEFCEENPDIYGEWNELLEIWTRIA